MKREECLEIPTCDGHLQRGKSFENIEKGGFPGGPQVKMKPSTQGCRFDSWSGADVPGLMTKTPKRKIDAILCQIQ